MAAIAHLPCSESRVPSSKEKKKSKKIKRLARAHLFVFGLIIISPAQEYGRE